MRFNTTQITPQQLYFGASFVALCLLTLLWLSARTQSATVERRLNAAHKQWQQLRTEREKLLGINALRAEQAKTQSNSPLQRGANQGIMYSLIEQAINTAGLTAHVQHLRPEIKAVDDLHVDEIIATKLRQLDRAQLVSFLHATEISIRGIRLENLTITKTKDGFMDVDAVFMARMTK